MNEPRGVGEALNPTPPWPLSAQGVDAALVLGRINYMAGLAFTAKSNDSLRSQYYSDIGYNPLTQLLPLLNTSLSSDSSGTHLATARSTPSYSQIHQIHPSHPIHQVHA